MKILRHISTLSLFTLAMSSFQLTLAAPGTLSDEPLQTSSSAPPNLMFLIDTSGSMRHVVPEESTTDTNKYNPSTTYIASCASAGQTPNDRADSSPDTLYIRIKSNKPKVTKINPSLVVYAFTYEDFKTYNSILDLSSGSLANTLSNTLLQ